MRASEAASAARQFVASDRLKKVLLLEFRDGYMPFAGAAIKDVFEELKKDFSPDISLHPQSPRRSPGPSAGRGADLEHLPGPFHPRIRDSEIRRRHRPPERVFSAIDAKSVRKRSALSKAPSVRKPTNDGFERETFMSLMRLRGMECNAPSGYAEAFFGRKLTL